MPTPLAFQEYLRRQSERRPRWGLDRAQVRMLEPGRGQLTIWFMMVDEATAVPPWLDIRHFRVSLLVAGTEQALNLIAMDLESGPDHAVLLDVELNPAPGEKLELNISLSGHGEIAEFFASIRLSMGSAGANDDQPRAPKSPKPLKTADLNYLARDYEGFTKLIFEQLALLVPGWQDREAADIGVMIVELIAYFADYLSYYQDAVGTEAYLNTARRRVSVARHARLLDYQMSQGCNARTWIHVQVSGTPFVLPRGVRFTTALEHLDETVITHHVQQEWALLEKTDVIIFESMAAVRLDPRHNRINFYSSGYDRAILAKGAVSANLKGHDLGLGEGDTLIIRQDIFPGGNLALIHRHSNGHPVRLISAVEQEAANGSPITRIHWHESDALPCDIIVAQELDNSFHHNLATAYGNLVPADHGLTRSEKLPDVHWGETYQPTLNKPGLTFAQAFIQSDGDMPRPARRFLARDPQKERPAIQISETVYPGLPYTAHWHVKTDLLGCGPEDRNFVAEIENEGNARLRFGDGLQGWKPQVGSSFKVVYRTGNGPSGNVGPGTLKHILADHLIQEQVDNGQFVRVLNLMPAVGGQQKESMDSARIKAPEWAVTTANAVTAEDYERLALSYRDISLAHAVFPESYGGRLVQVYVDRADGPIHPIYLEDFKNWLNQYRLLGVAVACRPITWVPLMLDMVIGLQQGASYQRVRRDLDTLLHNMSFTTGAPVVTSQIIAAAMKIPGLVRVHIEKFVTQKGQVPVSDARFTVGPGQHPYIHKVEIRLHTSWPDERQRP